MSSTRNKVQPCMGKENAEIVKMTFTLFFGEVFFFFFFFFFAFFFFGFISSYGLAAVGGAVNGSLFITRFDCTDSMQD
jgi:hypothetical protein